MARKAVFNILFGTNGTGKTTILKRFLVANERNLILPANRLDEAWATDANGNKIPEINTMALLKKVTRGQEDDFDYFFKAKGAEAIKSQKAFFKELAREIGTFKGNRKIVSRHRRIFEAIIHPDRGFYNGGLYIDDFKNMIPSNNLTDSVTSLFGDRRHRMLDIFMAAHSPTDMPPKLLDFQPNIFLFKTTSNFQRAENKYHESLMESLHKAQEMVNKHSDPYIFKIVKIDIG
jgi:predicted ATPase